MQAGSALRFELSADRCTTMTAMARTNVSDHAAHA